ncbi:MAG: CRTAC1 family protein [Xanthomonadales bacterium]|nr:CRTAC1 family protein [Xanthomonadales bacterium]
MSLELPSTPASQRRKHGKRVCARLPVLILALPLAAQAQWGFTEVSEPAGAAILHGHADNNNPGIRMMAGGVAAGDYDQDGDIDLYVITGNISPNALLRNNGDGRFTQVPPQEHGAGLEGQVNSGPVFADIDADGWPDLVVGGVAGSGYHVFHNNGSGRFIDVTAPTGIVQQEALQNDFSSAFGDPDGDGDLDLFVGHWGAKLPTNHYWINRGAGSFVASDFWAGIDVFREDDWSFAPVFTDLNGDRIQDLLVTSDYNTSQVLMCADNGRFATTTTDVIDDANGMGSAAADFDNDGDIDWFVSSIFDEAETHTWAGSGNRLYMNDGSGTFTNVTESAGIVIGHWGWGACAADFNNDGWLDIFHVNGFPSYGPNQTDFTADRSMLYINNQDGTFTERSESLHLDDTGQGRGVVCFDYDTDGDVDIFTANWEGLSKLYRNDLEANPGYLQVRLHGEPDNPAAVGATIRVTADGITQMREITVGSNYASQNPLLQHFGLGTADKVDQVDVHWPHGGETVLSNIAAGQLLDLDASDSTPPPFALEPGISAAWTDRARTGEGFMLEILPRQRAVLYWFTYDDAGQQDWYIAVGNVKGRRVLFPELLRISGGEFGAGFDPSRITETVVGSAAFTWEDCDSGVMDWVMGDDQGRMNLRRLSRVMGIDCGIPILAPIVPEYQLSGSWNDPTHSGEGYTLEVMANGQALVYWFSYDPAGKRRWFFGVGAIEQGQLVFDDLLSTRGGVFGAAFDPAAVEVYSWGTLNLDISCKSGTASYASSEQGFGSGQLALRRLTSLDGLTCE